MFQSPLMDNHSFLDFTYNFLKKDRIGISGSQMAAAKTTLLKDDHGRSCEPDQGRIEIGETVNIGYYAQEAKDMDPATACALIISRIPPNISARKTATSQRHRCLEKFLFVRLLAVPADRKIVRWREKTTLSGKDTDGSTKCFDLG